MEKWKTFTLICERGNEMKIIKYLAMVDVAA